MDSIWETLAGEPLPLRMIEVFEEGGGNLLLWSHRIDHFRQEIESCYREPWAARLDVLAVLRLLEQMRLLLVRAAPYRLCPCGKHETHCPLCEGRGWLAGNQVGASNVVQTAGRGAKSPTAPESPCGQTEF